MLGRLYYLDGYPVALFTCVFLFCLNSYLSKLSLLLPSCVHRPFFKTKERSQSQTSLFEIISTLTIWLMSLLISVCPKAESSCFLSSLSLISKQRK